jgi:hypothetical protein
VAQCCFPCTKVIRGNSGITRSVDKTAGIMPKW